MTNTYKEVRNVDERSEMISYIVGIEKIAHEALANENRSTDYDLKCVLADLDQMKKLLGFDLSMMNDLLEGEKQ